VGEASRVARRETEKNRDGSPRSQRLGRRSENLSVDGFPRFFKNSVSLFLVLVLFPLFVLTDCQSAPHPKADNSRTKTEQGRKICLCRHFILLIRTVPVARRLGPHPPRKFVSSMRRGCIPGGDDDPVSAGARVDRRQAIPQTPRGRRCGLKFIFDRY
jgi:hypothetical protein